MAVGVVGPRSKGGHMAKKKDKKAKKKDKKKKGKKGKKK